MTEDRTERDLSIKFERYLPTLHRMTQAYPPMSHLTREDIAWSWKKTPPEEKNGILLLAQFQEFFDQIHNKRSDTDQEAVMNRDINRKKDAYFEKYVKRAHEACEEMVEEGSLLGHWYISQSGKTELERDLDESGFDKVLQRPDGKFVIFQFATRFGNARDKIRHFQQRYGPKFDAARFIGTMPMREPEGGDWSMEDLKSGITIVAESTLGFGPNILETAFGGRR